MIFAYIHYFPKFMKPAVGKMELWSCGFLRGQCSKTLCLLFDDIILRAIFRLAHSLIRIYRALLNRVDKGCLIDLEFANGVSSSFLRLFTMRDAVD